MQSCMYGCVRERVCVRVCRCVCVFARKQVCVLASVCGCAYINKYTHTHARTHIHRDSTAPQPPPPQPSAVMAAADQPSAFRGSVVVRGGPWLRRVKSK